MLIFSRFRRVHGKFDAKKDLLSHRVSCQVRGRLVPYWWNFSPYLLCEDDWTTIMRTTALFSYSTLIKIAHLAVWTKKYARERDKQARQDWESTLQSKGCKSEECTGYICAKWFLHAHTHTHMHARTHTHACEHTMCMCMCMCLCMCTCMCMCLCMCVHFVCLPLAYALFLPWYTYLFLRTPAAWCCFLDWLTSDFACTCNTRLHT